MRSRPTAESPATFTISSEKCPDRGRSRRESIREHGVSLKRLSEGPKIFEEGEANQCQNSDREAHDRQQPRLAGDSRSASGGF